jgi:predicted SnoaL-like aldol condensation-catalyzing enzyme
MTIIRSATRQIAFSIVLATAAVQAGAADPPARNIAQEERNRSLVIDFYDRFFNRHEVDQAAEVVAEDYVQHNPFVADGKSPFVSFFKKTFAENPASKATIVRSATDGDLVYLHVHHQRNADDRGRAGVDIFRVQDGKIVEHWDVNQTIPETAANQNGMF